jgi:hypothetical protein
VVTRVESTRTRTRTRYQKCNPEYIMLNQQGHVTIIDLDEPDVLGKRFHIGKRLGLGMKSLGYCTSRSTRHVPKIGLYSSLIRQLFLRFYNPHNKPYTRPMSSWARCCARWIMSWLSVVDLTWLTSTISWLGRKKDNILTEQDIESVQKATSTIADVSYETLSKEQIKQKINELQISTRYIYPKNIATQCIIAESSMASVTSHPKAPRPPDRTNVFLPFATADLP